LIGEFSEVRQHALEQGTPFELVLRARRKDGQYRWFLVRYNPLRDEEGQIDLPPVVRPPFKFLQGDKLDGALGFEGSLCIPNGSGPFWKVTNPLTGAAESNVYDSSNSISATTLLPEQAQLRPSMRIMPCQIRWFFLWIVSRGSAQIELGLNS
jgi:PAS fold